MADDGAQLEIQQQINKLLQERQALMAASSKQLQDQTQIAMQLCAALKCESLDATTEKLEGMQGALEGAADAAEGSKNSIESVADAAGGLASKLDASKVAAVGAGVGLISGFKGGLGMLSAVGKGITGIVGSLGKVGASIVALPFKLMGGLIGMAQGGGGGPSPIREELEAIRGEFGSLASNEGKAVASSLGQVKSQMGDLAGTGLSVRQVYGAGQGGIAAAMKDIHELATALGPALNGLTDVIAKSGVELSIYRKGLGMTADQQASMLKQAAMAGKDPVKEMDKFASMAINMGEQFGVNAKVVGKSMATMAADVANFGQLSVKELGKAAIFASKLGIEAKELQGVISKFDNFEDAAKGAGEMAQAFGMNVDAMELMNAQNPAERLSMLQKAFKETGKSVEDMSRQELKMLASQSGLSEEAAKLAFSQKGMSMSYDDISKGGDKAEKKQLSQAEAMNKLADSIQKVTAGGGGGGFKGFFDAFLQGFGDGIKKSEEFRAVMRNIRKSLKVVFRAGKDIGKMFVKMFPGVKQFLKGLEGIFDPKKFSGLMKDVKNIFKGFFSDLGKDPVKATEKFIEKIQGAFKKFFGKQGSAGKDVVEGGGKILKAVKGIFIALLGIAIKGLTKLIKNIVDAIKNPKPVKTGLGKLFSDLAKEFGALFKTLLPPLGKALASLGKILFEKAKPVLIKAGTIFLGIVLTKMFITAALSAAKGAIIGKVGGLLGGALGKMFGAAGKNKSAIEGAKKAGETAGKSGGMGKGFASFIESLGGLKVTDILKAALKMTILAVSFIPVVKIFAFAAVEAYDAIRSANPLKVAAGMIALAVSIAAAVGMQKAAEQIQAGGVGKAIIGLAAGAALLTVGAVAFGLGLKLAAPVMDGVDWKKIPMAMLGLATAAFAAVGLSIAGALIVPAAAGMALVGLLAGAVMLGVGGVAFALALMVVNGAMNSVDMGSAALNMGALMLVVAASIPLALMAVGLGVVAPPAVPGLLAGAFMIGVGALAFAAALWVVSKTLGKLDMPKITGDFLLLNVVTMAAIPFALASILLGPMAVVAGMGALFGAGFLAVGGVAFATALLAISAVMGQIDMVKAVGGFLGLALVVGAAIPFAIASTILGPQAVPATIGAVFGAVFLGVAGVSFAKALAAIATEMDAIDMKKAATGFLALALVVMAALPMALATSALAIPATVGLIGIYPVSAFLESISEKLSDPIKKFEEMSINGKKVSSNADGIASAMGALALTALAAMGMVVFAFPPLKWLLNKGLDIIGDFMGDIAIKLSIPLALFAAMPIPAGGGMDKKIELLNAAVTGVEKLGNVAIGLAEIDADAVSGGTGQGKTIDAVTEFMKVLMGGMSDMIKSIATVAEGIPTDKLGAVQAIAKIIEGLGKLIGGVVPPIAELAMQMIESSTEGGGLFSSGKVNTDKFDSMMTSIKGLMTGVFGVMKDAIGPMIETVLNITIPGGVAAAGPKLDIISKAMTIITSMLKPMQEVLKMINEQEKKKGFFTKIFDKIKGNDPAQSMMGKLKTIMTGLVGMIKGNLPAIVKAVVSAADSAGDAKTAGPKLELVGKAIDIMGKMTDQLFTTLKLVKGKSGKPDLSALTVLFGPKGKPQESVMYKIADAVGESLALILNKMVEAVNKLKNPAAAQAAVDLVGSAISSVSAFAKAIIDVMKIGMPKPGDLGQIQAALPVVLDVMKKISNAIAEHLPAVIAPIILQALLLGPIADVAEKGMKIVSGAIGTVGEFASALKDVMSLVPSDPKAVDPGRLTKVIDIVNKVSAAIKTELPKLIMSLVDVVKKVAAAKIRNSDVKKVATLLEGVGHFASAMKDIMSIIPKDNANPQDLDTRLKAVGKVACAAQEGIEKLIGDGKTGMSGIAKDIQGSGITHSSINKLNKFFKGIKIFAEGLSALQGLAVGGGVSAVIKGLAKSIADNGDDLKKMITTLSGLPVKDINKAAGSMKTFGTMMTKSVAPALEAIDRVSDITADKVKVLTATMDEVKNLYTTTGSPEFMSVVKLAEVLTKPGKHTIKVETVKPNITANIHVHIDSTQLGKAVAATGEVAAAGDGTK